MSDFKLNKEQQKAVTFADEPLIIIAGAGTGKTKVITERIVWLIDQGKAKPDEILALTFTEKAANEMQERVDIALPLGYSEVWISTFHAFCDRILKQDGIHVGLNPDYKLMNQSESYYFVQSRLFDFDLKYFRPLSNPTKFVGALLKHFSRLQDEDISAEDYEEYAKKVSKNAEGKEKYPNVEELASAYRQYVDLKVKESVFDFGDLIANTLKLFRDRPNILKVWQEKFKYILVDEFQDTNYAQYEIVKMLSTEVGVSYTGDGRNPPPPALARKKMTVSGRIPAITVVADDDQSIYRFRGAAVSNVLQFRKDFPHSQNIVLTENYRSNQQILDSSYQVIQNNNPDRLEVKENINKKLTAFSGKAFGEIEKDQEQTGSAVKFNYFLKAADEAEWISEEILHLVKGKNFRTQSLHRDKSSHKDMSVSAENQELPIFESFTQSGDNSTGFEYSDIAILVRANDHSDEIIQALRYHGIPFQFGGAKKLFLRPEVKDMINILKILADYSDNVPMFGVLDFEILDLTGEELIEINKNAKEQGESLFKILQNFTNGSLDLDIREESKEKIKSLVGNIEKTWEKVKDGKTPGEVLLDFIKESGYLEFLTENGKGKQSKKLKEKKVVAKSLEAENEVKVQNIAKFFDFIKGFENTNKEEGMAALNKFVQYLDLVTDLGDSPYSDIDLPDMDAVHIITVHSAKGLEFPVVFLPNVAQGRFPSTNRSDQIPIPEELIKEILPEGDEHLQEERRLFYVGMTRAQDKLYITAAQHYGAGKRKQKISPFAVEAFGEKEVLEKLASPKSYESSIFSEKEKAEHEAEKYEGGLSKNRPANLSYSQIESYEKCPKQYKYKFILKVPVSPAPALVYGSVIHNTLKAFYEILKKNQGGFDGFEEKPAQGKLKEIFEEKWEAMTAKAGGAFRSKTYREKMHVRGQTSLEEFYKKLYSEDQRPFLLEQPFRLKIGDYTVSGVIDRVDLMGAKEGKQVVEIIDYKTGKVREQKEVDKDLQLAIYALAAREVFKLEPEILSLMFVDEGLKVETEGERMKKLEEKIKEKVAGVGDGVSKGNFGAKPGFVCKYCDFRDICGDAV
ncbi:ATP-dependent helicase [Candidatus Dojkabacteria bacterium]|nr:ATP-dependent helicase [Candidatus Dojkabacteria bacterium]